MNNIDQNRTDTIKQAMAEAKEAGKKVIVTHSGPFHADDVFAVMLMLLFLQGADIFDNESQEDVMIVRTRDAELIAAADYVIDVGLAYDSACGRFDHHQWRNSDPAGRRPNNGTRFAAAGLVWWTYGRAILQRIIKELAETTEESGRTFDPMLLAMDQMDIKRMWQYIDNRLIRHIDAVDTGEDIGAGMSGYSISQIIAAANPPAFADDTDDDDRDDIFESTTRELAGRVFVGILGSAVDDAIAYRTVSRHITALCEDQIVTRIKPRIMVLDRFVPFLDVLREIGGGEERPAVVASGLLLVVFPSTDGTWMVQCLPEENDKFSKRLRTRAVYDGAETPGLPVEWTTLGDKSLAEITGVDDAVFCHAGRFIAGARSKEGALKLAEAALDAAGYLRELPEEVAS